MMLSIMLTSTPTNKAASMGTISEKVSFIHKNLHTLTIMPKMKSKNKTINISKSSTKRKTKKMPGIGKEIS